MPAGVIPMILFLSSVAAFLGAVKEWLKPANALGLSLFRPYRGDPWPRGVQEDYDVHFDFSPRKPRPAPIQPSWSEIVVAPTADDGVSEAPPDEIEIEDLYGESAAIQHVHGDVRIAPH
jgi:hypothetical protein